MRVLVCFNQCPVHREYADAAEAAAAIISASWHSSTHEERVALEGLLRTLATGPEALEEVARGEES